MLIGDLKCEIQKVWLMTDISYK